MISPKSMRLRQKSLEADPPTCSEVLCRSLMDPIVTQHRQSPKPPHSHPIPFPTSEALPSPRTTAPGPVPPLPSPPYSLRHAHFVMYALGLSRSGGSKQSQVLTRPRQSSTVLARPVCPHVCDHRIATRKAARALRNSASSSGVLLAHECSRMLTAYLGPLCSLSKCSTPKRGWTPSEGLYRGPQIRFR